MTYTEWDHWFKDNVKDDATRRQVKKQALMYTQMLHGDIKFRKSRHFKVTGRDVLLLDTEFGSLFIEGADPRNGLSMFMSKEHVRRNWYYRMGLRDQYVPKVYAGPVPLKFGLWEQAEARHKKDVAKAKTERQVRREMKDTVFGINYGRSAVVTEQSDEEFLKRLEDIFSLTQNVKVSNWKPQDKLYISSGKPLRMHDGDHIETVKEIRYE